jgi:hypothetical protein
MGESADLFNQAGSPPLKSQAFESRVSFVPRLDNQKKRVLENLLERL